METAAAPLMELKGEGSGMESATGGKGGYEIPGEVLMAVYHKDGILVVHVNRARGLKAGDSNDHSDPYIKTYLLPDSSLRSKRKSAVKKRTVDPVFDEKLKYKILGSELDSRTLWLSVWDWDQFGRNQFLGELHLPLSLLDLRDTIEQWHPLQDKGALAKTLSHGELRLGLMYMPNEEKGKKGTLTIFVHQAKSLPPMDAGGLATTAVKCCLLPDRTSRGKRKTGVIKNNLNPAWEEQFTYGVSHEELLKERVLEVSVREYDCQGNAFIGGLRLGPKPITGGGKQKEWMDSTGDELSHWEEMLAHPGEWVELWHTLRLTLDPRPV